MEQQYPMNTQEQYAAIVGGTDYFFERCSQYYKTNLPLWVKAIDAYNGGRAYILKTLKKHPSETPEEYTDRLANAYNLNLIKYSTNRFGDYIFAKPPRRVGAAAEIIEDFDRQRKSVNSLMREAFDYHTICGLVWLLVDMPTLEGDQIDMRQKQDYAIRPWCKALSPLNVPDWQFDARGELEWSIIEETIVKKDDPMKAAEAWKRRTLYTKTYWQIFERQLWAEGSPLPVDAAGISVGKKHKNNLGKVPVIPYTSLLFNQHFNHPPIDDILTINDAVLAGESELLTNILKQTYGQLVLPISTQSIVTRLKTRMAITNPDIDFSEAGVNEAVVLEANRELSRTKAIFEDPEEKRTARYIQPSGANITNIIDHDDRLVSLMMKLYGFLVGVHTTQKESAESKSVDNISLAAQLSAIAGRLQELEKGVWGLFHAFDSSIKIPTVEYNTDFDIHELKAVIASIVELANINAGDAYKKQLKKTALNVMNSLKRVDDAAYESIINEIDAGKESSTPISFVEEPTHLTDTSGTRPDGITARSDYDKSKTARVSRTEKQ